MSEVKLLVLYMRKRLMSHTESDVFYEIEMPDYRPATTAEIREAHPKCVECKHGDFNEHYSTTDCIVDHRYVRAVNKDKDYCRHWEGKG